MIPFVPSPEQAAVIDHPGEPLRVAASAGTGKTTTIVQRLARAVAAGGDPARALGITFTNKAADELRERLRLAVGITADGREVEVATYHSFAASILDEFGSRIGVTAGSVLMDEGHRFELAGRVLRSLDGTDLDLTKIPTLRKDVLALADALNENLVDADRLRAIAPGDPDDVWRTRLALAEAADRFRREKTRLGLIEYGDLIRGAVEIVESDPRIAAELASRYDTVLLDEYQDTDRAQRRLLTTIFGSGTAVTAVGDTDQTIYEWRGASVQNFEGFPTDFPTASGRPATTLPLSVNRRSDVLLIDVANAVRARLPQLEEARPLRPRSGADRGEVTTAWFATGEDEAAWVAERIAAGHRSGIAYADMAVLCRRRDSLRPIAAALKAAGVPFTMSSMSDLLDVPEIADLVAWLRILADPSDESSLLRILLGGRYRLGLGDLAPLSASVPRGSRTGLIDAVLERGREATTDRARDALDAFAGLYGDLHRVAQASSVPAIVDAVIDGLDYWAEVAALPGHAATTTRLNVSRFIDLAGRWRPLDGSATLPAYLRYLDALAEPGRAEELDAAEPPAEDAVLLTTAHGAKGLEWSDVYLADVAHNVFPSRVQNYYEPASSAVALPYELRLDAESTADIARLPDADERKAALKVRHDHQEWRLAYVAVTRAKHRLVVSGHAWHGANKRPRAPGDLLELVDTVPGTVRGPWVDDPGPRPDPRPYAAPSEPPDPVFEDGWASALRRTIADPEWIRRDHPDLAGPVADHVDQLTMALGDLREPGTEREPAPFTTSVTNLVALAECPLKFRWIHHDRLPRKPRRSATLGTEFHRRVELHNLGVVALEDAIEVAYDTPDTPSGGPVTPGVDPWETFAASRFAHDRPTLVETPFEIVLDGRRLRGKVDAVYADGESWEIVDYKSGTEHVSDARRVQLRAYAIAAASGAFGTSPPDAIDVTFAFFGSDPPVEVTEPVDADWLDEATTEVSELLRTAESGPFDAAPSPQCAWCDFLHHCPAGRGFLAG